MDTEKVAIFKSNKIRRIVHANEWWFSVVDVIAALTDSVKPRVYWNAMKTRVKASDGFQLSTVCRQLKLQSGDNKFYETDCANTEGIFRIIQSIPSPKAEPFKRWLAKVGYERVQEIDDPELAQKRSRALYRAKGYPDNWIEMRMRGIEIREQLTDEWDKHGIKAGREYEILTAEISRATFGITPSEYKKLKGLKHHNLRDHMTLLESLFSQLGEAATTEITRAEDPDGFIKNKAIAKRGGKIAGDARVKLELETGKRVVSKNNYLPKISRKKLK